MQTLQEKPQRTSSAVCLDDRRRCYYVTVTVLAHRGARLTARPFPFQVVQESLSGCACYVVGPDFAFKKLYEITTCAHEDLKIVAPPWTLTKPVSLNALVQSLMAFLTTFGFSIVEIVLCGALDPQRTSQH